MKWEKHRDQKAKKKPWRTRGPLGVCSYRGRAPCLLREDGREKKGSTNFLRLLSDTMHSTSSKRQFVQGAPCSVTLQRTLRARQHWHALEALLLTERLAVCPSRPAWVALRLGTGASVWWSDGEAE